MLGERADGGEKRVMCAAGPKSAPRPLDSPRMTHRCRSPEQLARRLESRVLALANGLPKHKSASMKMLYIIHLIVSSHPLLVIILPVTIS
jgi:hypothetical protein